MYITMKMKTIQSAKRKTGFSLLEVMVALVIFSIGLIGLAGLQSASLSYNQSAYLRSQATYLAYDMLDKIRANPERSDDYTTLADSYTETGTAYSCYYSQTTGNCSEQELAKHDIFEWKQSIAQLLPGGKGKVEKIVDTGIDTFQVTLQWNDPSNPSSTTEIQIRSEE